MAQNIEILHDPGVFQLAPEVEGKNIPVGIGAPGLAVKIGAAIAPVGRQNDKVIGIGFGPAAGFLHPVAENPQFGAQPQIQKPPALLPEADHLGVVAVPIIGAVLAGMDLQFLVIGDTDFPKPQLPGPVDIGSDGGFPVKGIGAVDVDIPMDGGHILLPISLLIS